MPSLRRRPRARASWRACGRGALAFGRGGRLAGRGQRGLGLGELPLGRLVLLGEFRVARVQAVDLGLELLVLLLGGDRPLLGLVAARRRAGRSRPGRRRRAERAALTCPFSRASPSRRSAMARATSFSRRSSCASSRSSSARCATVSSRAARPPPGPLRARPPARGSRAASRSMSSGSRPRRSSGGAEVALFTRASARRDRAAHPLGELRQLVPGLLGPLQARRELPYLVLQERLALRAPSSARPRRPPCAP